MECKRSLFRLLICNSNKYGLAHDKIYAKPIITESKKENHRQKIIHTRDFLMKEKKTAKDIYQQKFLKYAESTNRFSSLSFINKSI